MWNYAKRTKYTFECLFLHVKPTSIIILYDKDINKLEIDYLSYDRIRVFDYIPAKKQHLRKFIKYIFTAEIGEI